jgi:hypothetical protein
VSKWTVGTREKEKEEDEPGRMTAGLAAAKAEAPPGTVDEGVEDRGAGACRCRAGAGTGAGCDAEWFRDAMVLSWKERDEGGGGARLGTRDGRRRRVLPCDAPPPSLERKGRGMGSSLGGEWIRTSRFFHRASEAARSTLKQSFKAI